MKDSSSRLCNFECTVEDADVFMRQAAEEKARVHNSNIRLDLKANFIISFFFQFCVSG